MLEQTLDSPVRSAVIKLYHQCDKAEPPLKAFDSWFSFAMRVGEERVLKAIDAYIENPKVKHGKKCLPFERELMALMPAPTQSTGIETKKKLAWYRSDGQWGGDWDGARRGILLEVAAVMVGETSPQINFQATARESFIAFALRKGCMPDEIEELARIYRNRYIGGLRQEIEQRIRGRLSG